MAPTDGNCLVASAARFNRALFELAERLAEQDVVVSRLHLEWASFGSWTLEVSRGDAYARYADALRAGRNDTQGPDVLKTEWDGRDEFLLFFAGHTPPLSAARGWVREGAEGCSDLGEAIEVAERRILEGAGNGA